MIVFLLCVTVGLHIELFEKTTIYRRTVLNIWLCCNIHYTRSGYGMSSSLPPIPAAPLPPLTIFRSLPICPHRTPSPQAHYIPILPKEQFGTSDVVGTGSAGLEVKGNGLWCVSAPNLSSMNLRIASAEKAFFAEES